MSVQIEENALMNRSKKRFDFLKIYLFCSNIRVCFQIVGFVRENMWRKTICMKYSMIIELTRICVCVCVCVCMVVIP